MNAGIGLGTGPRVVMLVQNAFEHDSRVEKQAEALAEAGCRVHVIALRPRGRPLLETRAGYRICRVDPQADLVAGILWRLAMIHRRSARFIGRYLDLNVDRREATVDGSGSVHRADEDAAVSVGTPRSGSGRRQLTRRRAGRRRRSATDQSARRGGLRRAWSRLGRLAPWSRQGGRVARGVRHLLRRMVGRLGTSVRRRLPSGLRSLARLLPMTRFAIMLRPDLVVAHDANTLAGAICIQRLLGTPFVYDSHELFLERNLPPGRAAAERWLWGSIESDGVALSAHRYSVSAPVCRRLEEMYGRAFDEMPNTHTAGDAPGSGTLRAAIEAGDEPIAVYLGRVTRGRGLETMLEAAALRPDVRWVIMGPASDGEYGRSLQQEAHDRGLRRVHVLPAVPRDEVGRWLADATVAVVPSDSASASYSLGIGNKSFHALAAGVPQVLSDQPGKRAFAEETGAAVLFPPGDAAMLAVRVGELVDDPSRHAALSEAARAAARRFDWTGYKKSYTSTCLRIVRESDGGPD